MPFPGGHCSLRCPDEGLQPHPINSQCPGCTEPTGGGRAISSKAGDGFQDLKSRGTSGRLIQIISKATLLPKYGEKDFNFTLCQAFYGAKKLSSPEYSHSNPTEIKQREQQS
jgi:hypothetical protein